MSANTSSGDDQTKTVEIEINGESVSVESGQPLIEVARSHGHYIPGWCHHPDKDMSQNDGIKTVYRSTNGPTTTPPRGLDGAKEDSVEPDGQKVSGQVTTYDGCDICQVEVNGNLTKACKTEVEAGMTVVTDTNIARKEQEEAMADIFAHHPHACINCPHKEGCDRITCSMGIPEQKRCCDLLGNCELEKSAEAIDIDWSSVPSYQPMDRSVQKTSIFDINWELCIGCTRCVDICNNHVEAEVWQYTSEDSTPQGKHTQVTVGMQQEMLAKSGCTFCTACAEACPTGTLMDNEGAKNPKLDTTPRDTMSDVVFPTEKISLTADMIKEEIPSAGGVYKLYNDSDEIIEINGTATLQEDLLNEATRSDAEEVEWEVDENFTQRETEMIEQFVNEHGHMPGMGGDDMDGLF